MPADLRSTLLAIDRAAAVVIRAARRTAFSRAGGVSTGIVSHRVLSQRLGPKQAAMITRRFADLNSAAIRAYRLRPSLLREHFQLMSRIWRLGAFQPPFWARRRWFSLRIRTRRWFVAAGLIKPRGRRGRARRLAGGT